MTLVIGFTGINTTDNPGPGIGVARSIKEASPETKLIGLGYDAHDPGHYMHWIVDQSYLLPFPTQGWEPMQERLLDIQKLTGLNVLIPSLDAELPLFIRYQDQLKKMGIQTFLPTEEQFEYRSKDKLQELASRIGCSYPRTDLADSMDDLVKIVSKCEDLPVMVKGKFYKAYSVCSVAGAVEKGAEIANEWGFPLLVQERLSGSEVNLIGFGDGSGNLLGFVTIKKQLTTNLGKVWTAVTIDDPQLAQSAKRFCHHTNWRGPFELECLRARGKLHLIEINPRFPAWVYFATAVGVNLPQKLLQVISSAELTPDHGFSAGKYLIRYTQEFLADMDKFSSLLTADFGRK